MPTQPDTAALLQILAMGQRQIARGQIKPAKEVLRHLRSKVRERNRSPRPRRTDQP